MKRKETEWSLHNSHQGRLHPCSDSGSPTLIKQVSIRLTVVFQTDEEHVGGTSVPGDRREEGLFPPKWQGYVSSERSLLITSWIIFVTALVQRVRTFWSSERCWIQGSEKLQWY